MLPPPTFNQSDHYDAAGVTTERAAHAESTCSSSSNTATLFIDTHTPGDHDAVPVNAFERAVRNLTTLAAFDEDGPATVPVRAFHPSTPPTRCGTVCAMSAVRANNDNRTENSPSTVGNNQQAGS